MNIKKNLIVERNSARSFLLDLYYQESSKKLPLVLFLHGFKGFKDWGAWGLIGEEFAKAGFAFSKFNFSHNGTSIKNPMDFDDLEAFGQNNYSKELADIDAAIDFLAQSFSKVIDLQNIYLIGHSRGGGISLIKARNDRRIKKLITWASVSSLSYAWEGNTSFLEQWKRDGVFHVLNGRTKQQMPLYYQLFEDFEANKAAYSVETAAKNLTIPLLVIHGSEDPAVPFQAAERIHTWAKNSSLLNIENANHVFGMRHPYEETDLPVHAKELVEQSISFFLK